MIHAGLECWHDRAGEGEPVGELRLEHDPRASILAKDDSQEFNNYKASPPNTGGWSSAGGQGKSPYVVGGVLANATFLGHSVRPLISR